MGASVATGVDSTRYRVAVNPETGLPSSVCSIHMGRKSISALEDLLRANVQALLKQHYGGSTYQLKKRNKTVRLETVQKILKGEGGCNVSSLLPLADAFGLKPYQLLLPDLNVKEPQQVVSARHVRALKQLREDE